VEDSLCGAAIALGVVKEALRYAIGIEIRRAEMIDAGRGEVTRASPGRSRMKVEAGSRGAPPGATSLR
jgi:hypothetical protein